MEENNHNSKGITTIWIIITIILVVTLVVGSGVYWWQLQKEAVPDEVSEEEKPIQEKEEKEEEAIDEAADWKTHKNEGWKYLIKHPSDLYIKSNPQGDKYPDDPSYPGDGGQTLIISDLEEMGIQDAMPEEKIHITITALKKRSDQSLYSYIKELVRDEKKISKISINGIEGFELGFTKYPSISIFINQGDWIYHLHGINYLSENLNSENFKVMKKIISTIRFIEVGDETADWKIFRNEKHGFEIKCPKEWNVSENDPYYRGGVSLFFNKFIDPADPVALKGFQIVIIKRKSSGSVLDYKALDKGSGFSFKADYPLGDCPLKAATKVFIGEGNYPARMVYASPEDKCFREIYLYILQNGDYSYVITPWPENGEEYVGYDGKKEVEKDLPKFYQILSTFKFIETEEAAD